MKKANITVILFLLLFAITSSSNDPVDLKLFHSYLNNKLWTEHIDEVAANINHGFIVDTDDNGVSDDNSFNLKFNNNYKITKINGISVSIFEQSAVASRNEYIVRLKGNLGPGYDIDYKLSFVKVNDNQCSFVYYITDYISDYSGEYIIEKQFKGTLKGKDAN